MFLDMESHGRIKPRFSPVYGSPMWPGLNLDLTLSYINNAISIIDYMNVIYNIIITVIDGITCLIAIFITMHLLDNIGITKT